MKEQFRVEWQSASRGTFDNNWRTYGTYWRFSTANDVARKRAADCQRVTRVLRVRIAEAVICGYSPQPVLELSASDKRLFDPCSPDESRDST